ncbi:uncharacterized protein LOC111519210 [Drosophila willistoni]|uniref:uncharacterized protein LOC111519210 n=1 Tax=Drosophila willistoni TaxID=7260 RepID=UPI00017D8871|nr:uncharacterized protein LOC111519210 [Drosophila willistoni]
MKVVTLCLLVLATGSCLLSTNANSIASNEKDLVDSLNFDDLDLELDLLTAELDGDYMEIDEFGIFRGFRRILKKALKTLRGVNCTIKAVVEVLDAATKYVDAVDACGVEVPKSVAKIVQSCKSIISTCNDIIHLNSNVCDNANYDDETDGEKSTTKKCFIQLVKTILKLRRQIKSTLKQIQKLPSDTNKCFVDATDKVKVSFQEFPSNIKNCTAAI